MSRKRRVLGAALIPTRRIAPPRRANVAFHWPLGILFAASVLVATWAIVGRVRRRARGAVRGAGLEGRPVPGPAPNGSRHRVDATGERRCRRRRRANRRSVRRRFACSASTCLMAGETLGGCHLRE